MKNPTLTAKLTFGQRVGVFIKKSPARMAFIIAVFLYLITVVINPAAYTHTSVAILDALKSVSIPAVEVHISDVDSREAFRQISYAGMYCEKTIKGQGLDGYRQAIVYLIEKYSK